MALSVIVMARISSGCVFIHLNTWAGLTENFAEAAKVTINLVGGAKAQSIKGHYAKGEAKESLKLPSLFLTCVRPSIFFNFYKATCTSQ